MGGTVLETATTLWGWDKDIWVSLIAVTGTVIVGLIAGRAKVQASRNQARLVMAEEKAEDHEERLAVLEPTFGVAVNHIGVLRKHIWDQMPPPPPDLPPELYEHFYGPHTEAPTA